MDPVIRNLKFALDRDVPRHWHGGRRSVTTFFDNLSTLFPLGERFFMTSVRAHLRFVADEKLQHEVRLFCGQEGMHGREHERYNAMLAGNGYPIDAMAARLRRLLGNVQRWTPKRCQLAATCALEHFTALMARTVLGDPSALEGAHPEMAALWRWHAAEENEHKCVAYDVYLAAGGTYLERTLVMLAATVIFWGKLIEQQVRMMRADGTHLSLSEWASLAHFLLVEPGVLRRGAPAYLAYYRRGFHPADIDCTPLVEGWKSELEGSVLHASALERVA